MNLYSTASDNILGKRKLLEYSPSTIDHPNKKQKEETVLCSWCGRGCGPCLFYYNDRVFCNNSCRRENWVSDTWLGIPESLEMSETLFS